MCVFEIKTIPNSSVILEFSASLCSRNILFYVLSENFKVYDANLKLQNIEGILLPLCLFKSEIHV